MNLVIKNICDRKSVRKFLDKQIPKEDIIKLIEAGIEAPSGHNTQSVRYTVVRNQELINHMSEIAKNNMKVSGINWISKYGYSERYHVLHHAPTVIIVSVKEDAYSPVEDCSAAIENILLAATSLNIGSLWVELIKFYFKDPNAMITLNIKEGYKPQYAICLGYENPERIFQKPKRNKDVYEFIDD
jgi:nitroreductase